MSTLASSLPLTGSSSPADSAEVAAVVREAFERGEAVYPVGGGTSLDYGLLPKNPGRGLLLERLNRVVDYPARDLTITVEAGMTMAALAELLAGEGQRLPIDVPQTSRATIGGVVATAASGPRRFGHGTMRDYVIGISVVDGRGMPFKGGGRVVKNVAGYDFCKLLTGSLGTLGVITQLTFKLKPLAEASAFVGCDLPDLESADRLLAALVTSRTTPAAVELLAGDAWRNDAALGPAQPEKRFRLAIGLEGSRAEVDWMQEQLAREWAEQGVPQSRLVPVAELPGLWQRLTEFQTGEGAALVVKFNVLPSRVCGLVAQLFEALPDCSISAHAASGIVLVRLASRPADVQGLLVKQLQPAAIRAGGRAVVWANPSGEDLTRQAFWGSAGGDVEIMRAVKRQFDPSDLLNPGRFVYGT